MSALVFYMDNPHLRDDEKRRLIQISRDLWSRDRRTEHPAPDPIKLAEQYWKPADGDL
jgi:hypothetical protein